MALLKAGAETDKKDADGFLALDLAPDKEVSRACFSRILNPRPSFRLTEINAYVRVCERIGSEVHRANGRAGGYRAVRLFLVFESRSLTWQ